ncbi:MAG: threonine efflux protein [Bacteroidetes bacterium]|nr:MAG: threonine efflux protein [Bacteroidota bacterium]
MIWRALKDGILLGLPLAISIGPAFFALLQTSIRYGFNTAAALATGIIISDIACVIVSYLGANTWFSDPNVKGIIGLCGGVVLIIFGTFNFFAKPKDYGTADADLEIKTPGFWINVIKGFFLNILNPFVIVFWLGAVTFIGSKYDFEYAPVIVSFGATLGIVYASDLAKAFIANRIRGYLNAKKVHVLNRVAALVLIGFGMWMLYNYLHELLISHKLMK